MANFIEDTKNKNQDLFINLVSNENDQGPARNVPLGDDLRLTIIHVPKEDQAGPKSDVQDQEHIIVVNEQGNNTQNQEQPTNIPPSDDIGQEEEDEQEQEQEQEQKKNDDDFELPNGARAKVSKPPSKRPAPSPKTGWK